MYIYELKDWPNFKWQQVKIAPLLTEVHRLQARLFGRMEALGFKLREEATLKIITEDVLKTSEIEGEKLDTEQVRSSVAKRLGMDAAALPHVDRNVEGIVEIMLDAIQKFDQPMTQARLFKWHKALFPSEKARMQRMIVGKWRTKQSGTMQVVSGPIGREKIYFEAPSYTRINKEMTLFIHWINSSSKQDLIIKSALAHFWFVTIHPFDDGNGRIARAIADMLLARSENNRNRFYSMSAQIQRERQSYYHILESSQKGPLDITRWMEWYLQCLKHAIVASDDMLQKILLKARFWTTHAGESFNERQRIIINRLLDDFYGKLTSSNWAKLTKCSQDTALRDINNLLERGILLKDEAGGRSTSYHLVIKAEDVATS